MATSQRRNEQTAAFYRAHAAHAERRAGVVRRRVGRVGDEIVEADGPDAPAFTHPRAGYGPHGGRVNREEAPYA